MSDALSREVASSCFTGYRPTSADAGARAQRLGGVALVVVARGADLVGDRIDVDDQTLLSLRLARIAGELGVDVLRGCCGAPFHDGSFLVERPMPLLQGAGAIVTYTSK